MNFDFSDDQKALQDAARRFLSTQCTISRVRAILDDPNKFYDSNLWASIAEQGWLGAAIPETYGGLGLGHLELCVLAYELGRALAPVPFASTVYVLSEALKLAGSDAQQSRLLPKIVGGQLIGALATSERSGSLTPNLLQAEVREGKLYGVKQPVTDGNVADIALVLANEENRPNLYLVELNQACISRDVLVTLDPTRNAARIIFDGAVAERLGNPGDGQALMDRVLDHAAVLAAFEQSGGADRCLELAREFALQRYAFGRSIASYQAIKHKLADIYVKNEIARSNAYYGAWALNSQSDELPIAASAARVAASDAYWFASKENIQTHGGVGFTWEIDCHLFYRRARQLGLVYGGTRLWKERLISHLAHRDLFEKAGGIA